MSLDEDFFRDLSLETEGILNDLELNTIQVRRPHAEQSHDPDFLHPTPSETDEIFELHYTQRETKQLKELGPERVDFRDISTQVVYIPTSEVERVLPDGVIHRENDIVILNGVEYQIQAIVHLAQYHNTSVIQKLYLQNRAADEQDQP